MKLMPRYDAPAIRFDLDSEIRAPFLAQRARFATSASFAGLTAEQWAAPSRCDGWTALDVARHLVGVNQWWHLAISRGVAGEPTRYLVDFDPTATPAAMVTSARHQGQEEVVAELLAGDRALVELVEGLDADGWAALAEAPPGHLPVALLVHHALWDAWVHERDVLLPLGLAPVEDAAEVLASLRYAAALGPALLAALGTEPAAYAVEVTDAGTRFVVETGDGVVRVHDGAAPAGAVPVAGTAVELTEVLSVRTPPGDTGAADLAAGLTTAFS